MKKTAVILLIVGFALILASVVIAFTSAANADIIGGAGWNTFRFYFGQISWLAWIGGCVVVASILTFMLRKK